MKRVAYARAMSVLFLIYIALFTMPMSASALTVDGFRYEEREDGLYVTGTVYTDKYLRIPREVGGKLVVGVAAGAFSGNENVETILLSVGIKYIEEDAFRGCHALKSITLPSTVESIGNYAFYECLSLKEISLPAALHTIGVDAFDYCTKLRKISVSEGNPSFCSVSGVLFTGDMNRLLKYPPNRQAVKYAVPDGVHIIASRAFNYAYLLEELTFPSTLSGVGEYAFASCASLRSLSFPEYTMSVRAQAFSGCNSLTELYFANPDVDFGFISGQKYSGLSLTVYGPAGATAEMLASTNGFAFNSSFFDKQESNQLKFLTRSLDDAWRYFPLKQEIEVSDKTALLRLKIGSVLPAGLRLEDHTIVGRPINWGVYRFTLVASDSRSRHTEYTYTLNISNDNYEAASSYSISSGMPKSINVVGNVGRELVVSVDNEGDLLTGVYIDGNPLVAEIDYLERDTGEIVIYGVATSNLSESQHIIVFEYAGGAAASQFSVRHTQALVGEDDGDNDDVEGNSENAEKQIEQPVTDEETVAEDGMDEMGAEENPDTSDKSLDGVWGILILSGIAICLFGKREAI